MRINNKKVSRAAVGTGWQGILQWETSGNPCWKAHSWRRPGAGVKLHMPILFSSPWQRDLRPRLGLVPGPGLNAGVARSLSGLIGRNDMPMSNPAPAQRFLFPQKPGVPGTLKPCLVRRGFLKTPRVLSWRGSLSNCGLTVSTSVAPACDCIARGNPQPRSGCSEGQGPTSLKGPVAQVLLKGCLLHDT